MLEKAEIIRCRRQEQVINRQFGFIDHTQQREDFLAYFEETTKKRYQKWKIVYMHFHKFTGGKCTFGDVTVELCTRFREYLLNANQLRHKKKKVSRNSAAGYFSTFRALLKQAYKERLLTENINDFLDYIEWEEIDRDFLTQEELIQLAQTACKHDILRSASLFSCLTGLRISDIENLQWKHIQPIPGIGLCIVITIQKTKTPVKLPLCDEAIELMGERTSGKVFKGLKRSMTGKPLKDWIEQQVSRSSSRFTVSAIPTAHYSLLPTAIHTPRSNRCATKTSHHHALHPRSPDRAPRNPRQNHHQAETGTTNRITLKSKSKCNFPPA